MPDSLKVQVLIVGSGAGGATTAVELAAAGFEVVVLEDGARPPLTAYGGNATAAMQHLYRNRGMTPILGSVPIGYVEGRCIGGSTEINSGFWHRLPPEFGLRWQAQYGLIGCDAKSLEPHFVYAEEMLHVNKRSEPLPASTVVFQRGIDAMGWSAQQVARAANGCKDNNTCASGCPKGAKQGMSRRIIPLAESRGARFISDCRVKVLIRDGKRIRGVLAELKRVDGSIALVRIDAEYVFLCAGPSQTPALLRRSGIKYHVGDSFQIHPMLKVAAHFDEEINAQDSVLPLLQVKEFWPDICLGGSFFTTGHLGLTLSDNWPDNFKAMDDYRRIATYYVAVRGTGRGMVRPALDDDHAHLFYELSNVDVRHLSQGLARLSTLLLAAGAKKVYPSVQGLPSIESELDAVKWLDTSLPRAGLSLSTVHAFSSCPIGEREDRCAADSFGKIHRLDNLYINDASMLPDSPGINPQGTVMALARRNALNFIERQQRRAARKYGSGNETTGSGIEGKMTTNLSAKDGREGQLPVEMPMAIVTGAPGWLGTRLVQCLIRGLADHEKLDHAFKRKVRVLVLKGARTEELAALGPDVELLEGDVTDKDSLKALFAGAEGATVYHIAGIIHPTRGVKEFFAVNVQGTRNMLEAAAQAKVRRFIHMSSNSPIGCNRTRESLFDEQSPFNPYMNYGKSKKLAEDEVNRFSLQMETVILRAPWFYGVGQPPRQTLFFAMVRDGKAPIVGDGGNLRSMSYVDNLCQGLMLAEIVAEAKSQTYWIGDRRPYTMNEIVDTIEKVLERDFQIRVAHKRMRLPGFASEVALLADALLQGAGLYHQKIHVLSEMNKNIACSIARAERELGYDPKVELEEGMRRSIQDVLDRGQQL